MTHLFTVGRYGKEFTGRYRPPVAPGFGRCGLKRELKVLKVLFTRPVHPSRRVSDPTVTHQFATKRFSTDLESTP